jgi:hypothetical protein
MPKQLQRQHAEPLGVSPQIAAADNCVKASFGGAELLPNNGIDAIARVNTAGNAGWLGGADLSCVEVLVPPSAEDRAKDMLRDAPPPPVDEPTSPDADQDVSFECEDCGEIVTFPGDGRGRNETRPRSRKYVDVREN